MVLNPQLHTDHLVNPFFLRLHVARQELGLLPDLLYVGLERLPRKRIDLDLGGFANPHTPDLRFGNIDHQVKLVGFKQLRYGRIRRKQISGPKIHCFDHRSCWCPYLALSPSRFGFLQLAFRQCEIRASSRDILCSKSMLRPVRDRFGGFQPAFSGSNGIGLRAYQSMGCPGSITTIRPSGRAGRAAS